MGNGLSLSHFLSKNEPREESRYTNEDSDVIIAWLEAQGLCFENYSILDVGCGSLGMSVPLSQRGAKLTALDISPLHLKRLASLFATHHVMHAPSYFCANWHTIEQLENSYDIVIASMTPAISSEADLQKLIHATRSIGVFVGWQTYQQNTLLNALFLAHGVSPLSYNTSFTTKECLKFLEKNALPYNVHYFKTSWRRDFNYDEAKEYAYKHLLQMHSFPNEALIDSVLSHFMENNTVIAYNDAYKGIVLFSKCPLLKQISFVCQSY